MTEQPSPQDALPEELSASVAGEMQESLADGERAEALPTARLGIFRVGDGRFGIDGRHCREVLAVEDFTPLPLAPEYVLGVANLRGSVLPLLRVHALLHQHAPPVSMPQLALVVADGALTAGILVDEVLGFEPYEPTHLAPLAGALSGELTQLGQGRWQREGAAAVVLDGPGLLDVLRIRAERSERPDRGETAPVPASRPGGGGSFFESRRW